MNDESLFRCIHNPENLYHAWKKAKNVYDNESDFVFNRQEISEYEAALQNNLQSLSERLKESLFQMKPMRPMPLPKANGEEKMSRQHFHICLEDQIVWLAVINVLGPLLDDRMPYWSFGNRLYMPIWKEDDDNADKKITKFGTYRPSSRKIYRNWTSSWPLFRKAAAITAKKMLHCHDMSEDDSDEIATYDHAPDSFKIKTWESGYWSRKAPKDKDVFYATIDLKKFYPSIDAKKSILSDSVLKIIGVDPKNRGQSKLYALLEKLLSFTLDNQYPAGIDPSAEIEGDREGDHFFGIPTGLFVAGFLANIAMLEIDQKVQEHVDKSRRIAHFRFVDDHVFLAYSVEELLEWLLEYERIVADYLPRVAINSEKIEPQAFKAYYDDYKNDPTDKTSIAKAAEQCRLDPIIASPFSTLTLKKLSGLNKDPFELMDESEKADLLRDVEHLLVTDFPETEIRKDTRVSWAAMLLSRLIPEIDIDTSKRVEMGSKAAVAAGPEQAELRQQLNELEKAIDGKRDNLNKKVFSLLLKALKDNIAKPKIWRRCTSFCRTTGYNGLDLLLKQLAEDTKLSDNGKSYIFATVINEVSSCLLTCIAIHKLNRYSLYEKQNAERFANSIFDVQERLFLLSTKYHMFYTNTVLEQLRMSLCFYASEVKGRFELNDKDTYAYACYIWYALERTANAFFLAPPQSLTGILKSDRLHRLDLPVLSKLHQMYALNTDSPLKKQKTLATWVKKKADILPDWTRCAVNEIDLLASEWTCLEIILKAIEAISAKRPTESVFSFDNQCQQAFNFANCSPYNFRLRVAQGKSPQNPWGWADYKRHFKKCFNLEFKETSVDERYDYVFYNTYGNTSVDKRQVCSLATLLITLLSDDLAFPPLFNRRDPIDRSYTHILFKAENLNFSSYTRAILVGALSYREFEKNSYSIFDGAISKRDDDADQDPIRIENINDLRKHTLAAQKRLERYQLSLENQTPRQLIPISLVNLSRAYNPYLGGDE